MLDLPRRRGLGGPQLWASLPIDRPRGRASHRRRELLGQRRQCGLEDRGVHGEHEHPEPTRAVRSNPAERDRRRDRSHRRLWRVAGMETAATSVVRPVPSEVGSYSATPQRRKAGLLSRGGSHQFDDVNRVYRVSVPSGLGEGLIWSRTIRFAISRNFGSVPGGIVAPAAAWCPPPWPPTAPLATFMTSARSRPRATSSRVVRAETLIPSDAWAKAKIGRSFVAFSRFRAMEAAMPTTGSRMSVYVSPINRSTSFEPHPRSSMWATRALTTLRRSPSSRSDQLRQCSSTFRSTPSSSRKAMHASSFPLRRGIHGSVAYWSSLYAGLVSRPKRRRSIWARRTPASIPS